MISASIIAVFIILLLLGVPLFIVIGSVTALCMVLVGDYPLMIMFQQMFSMTDSTALLAIPLFIVASTFMTRGKSAGRLVEFVRALVGWLPGGMALSTIFGCLIFAALAGLSPAAIIAVGSMMLPGLTKAGYSERFSLGLVTSSGSIGILVPPSIVVLIFGIVGELNIEALFIAGVVPIIIIVTLFMAYSLAVGKAVEREHFDLGRVFSSIKNGFWAILLPVIVGWGIFSGVMTVVQAGAIAAVYAFVVEFAFYRSVRLKDIPELMREAGSMIGMLLIIISVTYGFNWFLTVQGIPMTLTDWLLEHFKSPILFLLSVNILLLFLGCLMDILSAVFITVPLLLPAAVAMGVNPIHFGIIFIINFEIGYLTPPVGINLFTSGAVFKKPVETVARSVLPFLLLLLCTLALVTYVPSVTLWLVRLSGNM